MGFSWCTFQHVFNCQLFNFFVAYLHITSERQMVKGTVGGFENRTYPVVGVPTDHGNPEYISIYPEPGAGTVYPKKYAHGFCFAVLCCGYTLNDFPISIRLTSLALRQSNDCPSASKATLMNMDRYFMWIHYERLHNHNKAKHNKTVCILLEIYCTSHSLLRLASHTSGNSSQLGTHVSHTKLQALCSGQYCVSSYNTINIIMVEVFLATPPVVASVSSAPPT